MPLLRYLAGRIWISAVTLLIVSVVIFLITETLPGDVATRILGRAPDPEQLALLRKRLGLDQPLPLRYLDWLWGLLRGDLGVSLISGQPVSEILGRRLVNTGLLAAFAFLIYFPIAFIPAAFQAINRDKATDQAISGFSLLILSIPDFLLATLFVLLFAAWVPLFPPRSVIDETSSWVEVFQALVLPGVTTALVMGTYAMRYLRDSLIEVLQSEYIRMARLNGISERKVLWRHAFPNALIPTINITSLNLTYLFGGVVVVEQVFAFPGFGRLLVDALLQLDIPVVQITVLISAAVYVFGNLLADILSIALNPKLKSA